MYVYAYVIFVMGFFLLCALGTPSANYSGHFLKKCGNAAMLRCVKNTVLLFINMPISWWKLYNKTCQEEINKLMCSWYMMRVHRDVEKTGMDWIALCKQGSDRSSPEIYLYIYPHINSRGQQED